MQVGIVGTGNAAQRHFAAYTNAGIQVNAVCGRHGDNALRFAEKYGIPNYYNNLEDFMIDPAIKAVSIVTANASHCNDAIAAMRAGKDVLVEKPMATTLSDAEKMLAVSKETGRTLMVGMKYRFSPDYKLLRDLVEKGDFGELYYSEIYDYRRHGHPGGSFASSTQAGGGVLFDSGVHFLDAYYFVAGKPRALSVNCVNYNKLGLQPEIKDLRPYISASSAGNEANEVEDLSISMIRFENGPTLIMPLSYALNVAGKNSEDSGYRFCGTKMGAAKKTGEGLRVFGQLGGYMTDTSFFSPLERSSQELFNAEIAHFCSVVAGEEKSISPAEDGVEIMRILEALYKSAQEGHEVIIAK